MFLVIYFESNESVLCYELRIIPKNGKALSRKRDNVSNLGYVRKWKT